MIAVKPFSGLGAVTDARYSGRQEIEAHSQAEAPGLGFDDITDPNDNNTEHRKKTVALLSCFCRQ